MEKDAETAEAGMGRELQDMEAKLEEAEKEVVRWTRELGAERAEAAAMKWRSGDREKQWVWKL